MTRSLEPPALPPKGSFEAWWETLEPETRARVTPRMAARIAWWAAWKRASRAEQLQALPPADIPTPDGLSDSMRLALKRRWAVNGHTIRALGRREYLADGWDEVPSQVHDRWGRGWPLTLSRAGEAAEAAGGESVKRPCGLVVSARCDRCPAEFVGTRIERQAAGWVKRWSRIAGSGVEQQQDLCPTCRSKSRRSV